MARVPGFVLDLSWICAPCLQAGAEPCEPGGPCSAGAAEQERGGSVVGMHEQSWLLWKIPLKVC